MIFNKAVNIERLTLKIESSSIATPLQKIVSSGSNCEILFDGELPVNELVILGKILSKHKPLPLETIDTSVTARQMRTAIIMSGISIETIESVLNSQDEPTRSIANVAWNHSYRFHRDNALVISLAPAMGLTVEELDELWVLARSL
jgi:hypothetical protein